MGFGRSPFALPGSWGNRGQTEKKTEKKHGRIAGQAQEKALHRNKSSTRGERSTPASYGIPGSGADGRLVGMVRVGPGSLTEVR